MYNIASLVIFDKLKAVSNKNNAAGQFLNLLFTDCDDFTSLKPWNFPNL